MRIYPFLREYTGGTDSEKAEVIVLGTRVSRCVIVQSILDEWPVARSQIHVEV